MKIAFVLKDDTVPRTHFHQEFIIAAAKNHRFSQVLGGPDMVLFSAEECSPSLNWPKFGDQESAFLRGQFAEADLRKYGDYTCRYLSLGGLKCLFNMTPGQPLGDILQARKDIVVADINLLWPHRVRNRNTVSLPALPIIASEPGRLYPKDIFASFRGYRSHPCREQLRSLHNDHDVICDILLRQPHIGYINASTRQHDLDYENLLKRSLFAFVPRGDANFTIRLLEVMSFGCIPVVFSDGWVLPFDHTVDWSDLCIQFPENEIEWSVHRLRRLSAARIYRMQAAIHQVYTAKFASMERLAEALFQEVEALLEAQPD